MPTSAAPENPRVLLVDDNDEILALSSSVLAPTCRIVGTAKDGPSAIQAAEALRPDVIVLDISLRDMTGFEVASRLRLSGSTSALVFLSLYAEEDIVARAQAVGAIGYVVKTRLVVDLTLAVAEAHMGRGFVSPLR